MTDTLESPSTTSRERLSQISHHFLSDQQHIAEKLATRFVLPVFQSDQANFPCIELAKALTNHGIAVIILNLGGHDQQSAISMSHVQPVKSVTESTDHQPESLVEGLIDNIYTQQQTDKNVILLPFNLSTIRYTGECKNILMTVDASAQGIKSCYEDIRKLITLKPEIGIGVTITNAKNASDAQHRYEKLAIATHRFMNLTINSYGYITNTHQQKRYEQCIDGLTRFVLNDWQRWNQNRGAANQVDSETNNTSSIGWGWA
ncbi:MAG: hypothetical protein ACE5EH_13015 [Gammaproteobacteria bacterium]